MIKENDIYQDRRSNYQVKVITLAKDWPSAEKVAVVVDNADCRNKWCIPLHKFLERYSKIQGE